MMKYIRTKAGEIYDIDDLYICDELNGNPYGVKNSSWVIYKESIIKQADTIEELCDAFVIKINDGYVIINYYDYKKLTQCANEDGVDIYGAIWTFKGLIYVAKMKNKVEFKLL